MINNKKGSMEDNFWVLVQIFGFALFMLIMMFVWNNLTSTNFNGIWEDNAVSQNAKSHGIAAFNQMDNIFLFVYFGLHIGMLVLAYMLREIPIILIAIILLAAILVMIAAPISNIYQDISAQSTFSSSAASLSKMGYIMNNLPSFELIWAVLTGIALVGFSRLD